MLEYIGKLHIPHIKAINILFLTHSPFILSDIPARNVLRIKNGDVEPDQPLTFAGNIHEMLAESFFMDATTGDFARLQYQAIIKFYEQVRNASTSSIKGLKSDYAALRRKFMFIVSQIGEDVIRGILENHLQYLDERLGFSERQTAAQLQELQIN